MSRRLFETCRRVAGSVISRAPIVLRTAIVDAALWQLEERAYSRLRDGGFRPGGIIDIGANCGDWTKHCADIFPDAQFFMIEARSEMEPILKQVSMDNSNVRYVVALLGPQERNGVEFYVQGSGSSIYHERSDIEHSRTRLSMTTLDRVLPESLCAPLFLKLDVQGAELDILRGASVTMEKAEVVQLEVPLLAYNEGAPTSSEVVSFMDQRGFAIFDISGFIRPFGMELVQIDILFVRKISHLRPTSFQFRKP